MQIYKLNNYTKSQTPIFQSRISAPKNMQKNICNDIINGNISKHFVPTPTGIIDRMIFEIGGISQNEKVLEPSAGYGHIADRIIKTSTLFPKDIDVIEPVENLRKVLYSKGYNLVDYDILSYNPQHKYDKIIMNPPFDNGSDVLHLLHCYDLLKPGGKLVSILPENDFLPIRQPGYEKWQKDWLGNGEKKEINEYVQDLLKTTNAKVIKLGKVFETSDVPDDIETRMVVITKPINTCL